MKNVTEQRGMSAVGTVLVLALIGFFALIAMKVVPAYSEYFSVASSLESLTSESNLSNMAPQEIRKLVARRFQINNVRTIEARDVKIFKQGRGVKVSAQYEVRNTLFGNIDLVIRFDKSVEG